MIPNALIFIFCKIKHSHAKMQALHCVSNLQFVQHPKNYGYTSELTTLFFVFRQYVNLTVCFKSECQMTVFGGGDT